MIGEIKIIGDTYYFQANGEGTLVKLYTCSLWRRFWLEFRQCIKPWDMIEAIEFAEGGRKR